MSTGRGTQLADGAALPRTAPEASFFEQALRTYYQLPSYVLWRTIELRLLARQRFDRPVLDLGCGDGTFSRLLFSDPVDVGSDLDVGVLRRAARSGAYRSVQAADAGRLPYRDGVFGTVFSNSVLEHIPHYREVLQEIGRVVRPGGRVMLTVPSDRFHEFLYFTRRYRRRGQEARARAYADAMDRRLSHFYYHNAPEWTALVEAVGFEDIAIESYLPVAALGAWNVLEDVFARPWILGYPLYGLLGSPRLGGLRAVPRTMVRVVLGRWLSRLSTLPTAPGEGAGLLISGRRRTAPGTG